ncbi:MAG: hypothetical protein QG608_2200 [Actinomycetota bacterium]|nr:hypothetical protein [Actinomycetota bacterium]
MAKKSKGARGTATTVSAADIADLVNRFLAGAGTADTRVPQGAEKRFQEFEPDRRAGFGELPPKIRHPEVPTSVILEGIDPLRFLEWRELVATLPGVTGANTWDATVQQLALQEAVARNQQMEASLLAQVNALRAQRGV